MDNILTFILEYVYQEPSEYYHGGCYWSIIDEAGDDSLLEYFHDYNSIAEVLYDEANIPDPESNSTFKDLYSAAAEGILPVLGDTLFVQIEMIPHSWEGEDWNILSLVWNADHLQKCMKVLEEMSETIADYGLCKCGDIIHHDHTTLGRYAQEHRLCYKHAQQKYDHEQKVLQLPKRFTAGSTRMAARLGITTTVCSPLLPTERKLK